MVASLSDMAAMGARPTYALVSISGPDGTDLQELYRGIGDAADTFDSPVVGGDLTNASELVVSVTVAGTCSGSPVRRDGARAGDEVWVTGPLGASAAGLRLLREGGDRSDPLATAHARPWPRIGEGQAARLAGATAMIDVSDGLAADVLHLAEASAVGIELTSVPIAAGASLDDALGGGEDFELVFCAPAGAHIGESFGGIRRPIRVGTCTDATVGIRLNGEELPPTGWQHRW
jgi:thiamine-monophosphate kinase